MKILTLFTLILGNNLLASDVTDPGQISAPKFHENKGCPINSICSKEMGQKLTQWEKAISGIKESKKNKILKNILNSSGLPIEFLGKEQLQENIKPVMWTSRCKLHNPRNPNNNIYRSMQFFKSIPNAQEMVFKSVNLYDGLKVIKYKIPYKSHPILIQNDKLIITQDYDDLYYQLGINPDGKLSVENFPYSLIKKALNENVKDTKCPDKLEFNSDYFRKTYCHKIYDIDANKLKTIQVVWSCP